MQALLRGSGIELNGPNPWDPQIHHRDTLSRVLARGTLGLGDSYAEGWWDCERLDEFFARAMRSGVEERLYGLDMWWAGLRARLWNLQSVARASQVAQAHYDLSPALFEAMLDPSMAYSCGYWATADTLEQAQFDKLELICRKLQLQPGMTLLDVGCGWQSLMRHAAQHHGVSATGLTISGEQAQWARDHPTQLPVQTVLSDYRLFNTEGSQRFDRVASVGMFEHVGHKNQQAYFSAVRRSLRDDGLFLLHTIGRHRSGEPTDPWVERHIFPNGALPSSAELAAAVEPWFVIEDWHNFGADYDRTLMAWHARFEAAWPQLAATHDERFHRQWRYYLLCCAGAFRARSNQLWQLVLSPQGVAGGYRRPDPTAPGVPSPPRSA